MPDPAVLDLGYETAGEILASVALGGVGFGAADLGGELFWTHSQQPDRETRRALRDLLSRTGTEGSVEEIGDRGGLVVHPIHDVSEDPRAWLVAWTDEPIGEGSESREWKRVRETLPRVAAMLGSECRLAVELSGAVRELGERYEELNVVFRMERESRGADPRDEVVQSMLTEFLAHLRIDVGLFVAASCQKSLSGRGTERTIPNLDLVLTELRGTIWRFLSASRKPLVMNEPGDERRGYLLTNLPFKLLAIPADGCEEPEGGLLLLRHLDEPDFTNSDMSLARVFFGQAMVLMRNQALLERMERFTRQIASSLVETVEAKDPYTRGHSERVERITAGLGDEVGVPPSERADLLWGALLHDIGKIGIPDAILMKPGRLTDDEYTFIKTHPTRSYEILRHIEQLGPAALDAARYHQERFDGQGYPFGLAGVEIPLVARVVSVADTYDAVTSSRSYRAASTHEEALEIVRGCAGSQLDPEIVSLFLLRVEQDEEWLNAIRPSPHTEEDG